MDDIRQGIVHIIGPEQGLTLPGHDHRLRRQPHRDARRVRRARLRHRHLRGRARAGDADADPDARRRTCASRSTATLAAGVTRQGHRSSRSSARSAPPAAPATSSNTPASAIRALSMEGRMTVCNMSIEAGARAGLIAPDETTFDYLKGRPHAPKGAAWEQALAYWKTLPSDEGARFDREVDARRRATIAPQVTWGTSPAGRAADHRHRARTRPTIADEAQARRDRARARLHGPEARHAAAGRQGRPRLHRLLHQRPDRGPARRRRRSPRAARSPTACARWSCPAPAW